MTYTLIVSESARIDSRNIYEYIEKELQVPQTAKKVIRQLLAKIENLKSMPRIYKKYPHEPLKTKEIRYIPVKNYIIFYKIFEETKTVVISRIIYGGREIKNQMIEF